jgi:hypothetical protein
MLKHSTPQSKHKQIKFNATANIISSAVILVLSAVILFMSFPVHISSATLTNVTYCLMPIAAISGLVFTIQIMIGLNVEKHVKPIK